MISWSHFHVSWKKVPEGLSLGLNFPTSDQLQNFDRALAVGGHDHWRVLSPSHRRNELSINAKTTTKTTDKSRSNSNSILSTEVSPGQKRIFRHTLHWPRPPRLPRRHRHGLTRMHRVDAWKWHYKNCLELLINNKYQIAHSDNTEFQMTGGY